MQQTLPAGAYSMLVNGTDGGTGIALAEIYDTSLGRPDAARLINVSARGRVGANGDVLVAGFVIRGATSKTLLIRGAGPTLQAFDVTDAIYDPKLELYRGRTRIAANDDVGVDRTIDAANDAVAAFGLNTQESALLITLPPGDYTAQVSSKSGPGVALVEVYEIP